MPNISHAVTKRAARIGPKMKPIAPKNMSPPSVEKKMSSSCILVSCPTSRGRSTLSTLPTTSAQNSARAIPRQISQSPVDFTRLIDELLETRPDDIRHAQRFIGPGPEHRQERRHHEHQQQQERRDRGERRAAPESAENPLIDGVAQPAKIAANRIVRRNARIIATNAAEIAITSRSRKAWRKRVSVMTIVS